MFLSTNGCDNRDRSKDLNVARQEQVVYGSKAEPLVRELVDDDPYKRKSAAEGLDKLNWKPQTQQHMVQYLIAKQDWDALRNIGAPAVEELMKRFKSSEKGFVLFPIAGIFGEIKDPRTTKPLIEALKFFEGNDPFVDALTKIKDPIALEPLIEALKREGKEEYGYSTSNVVPLIRALGEYKDPAAVRAIIDVLRSVLNKTDQKGSMFIRVYDSIAQAAIDSLIKIGDPSIEPIVEMLRMPDTRDPRSSKVKLADMLIAIDPSAAKSFIEQFVLAKGEYSGNPSYDVVAERFIKAGYLDVLISHLNYMVRLWRRPKPMFPPKSGTRLKLRSGIGTISPDLKSPLILANTSNPPA